MALRVRRASSIKVRVTTTLMLVFALVAQPLCGLAFVKSVGALPVSDHVVINEIMADSVKGEKEWVELYNPTNSSINLNKWRITDGSGNFTGIFSNDVTIAAKGYLLRESSNSDSHLLDSTAQLRLESDNKNTLVDAVTYVGITAGKSYARTYDAADTWIAQSVPTKGVTNGSASAPIVVTPTPQLNGENFNTHSGDDYKGFNVGFNTKDFGIVSSVTVDLYQNDTKLVTNTGTAALNTLITNGEYHLSTPFYVQGGVNDDFWIFGTQAWALADKPTKAIITVVGSNGTKDVTLTPLAEPNDWVFESLLPIVNDARPIVAGENFNTHSDTDYKGIDVEFSIANFKTVASVSVDLYDAEDNLLVTNTHNQKLLDLIADGKTQLNTSFIITPGSYVEELWNLGSRAWTRMDQPARAVVTVTGTDDADVSVTQTAELAPLVELNDVTFLDVLPVVAFVPVDPELPVEEEAVASDNGTLPLVNPIATSTPLLGNTTLFGNNVFTASNHFVASTPSQEVAAQNAAVLGTQDTAETPLANTAVIAPSSQGWKIFSLAWYWWLLIAIAAMAAWMRMAAGIRRFRGADDL